MGEIKKGGIVGSGVGDVAAAAVSASCWASSAAWLILQRIGEFPELEMAKVLSSLLSTTILSKSIRGTFASSAGRP
jgi:hypothetical protein